MAEENAGVASNFAGMLNAFVDPAGTARRVPAKLFWLWPVITLAVIYLVFGYLMLPYVMQMVDMRMSQQMSQANLPAERIESARRVAHMFTQFSFAFTPVVIIAIIALMAWLVGVTGSM